MPDGRGLMSNEFTIARALLLVAGIEDALASGVRHYNRAGKRLRSVSAVLETLNEEGEVAYKEKYPGTREGLLCP
jgi:hypothetical protein